MEIREWKKKMRLEMKESLQDMPRQLKRRGTREIGGRLEALQCYQRARRVMFYVGVGLEINTIPLMVRAMAADKQVSVPYCLVKEGRLLVSHLHDLTELTASFYGLLEPRPEFLRPLDPAELDLVVVPGLAFDKAGNRLGRGGGYYDRLLTEVGPNTVLLALAFDFQVCPHIFVEAHDRPVHGIITPSCTILCRTIPKGKN